MIYRHADLFDPPCVHDNVTGEPLNPTICPCPEGCGRDCGCEDADG